MVVTIDLYRDRGLCKCRRQGFFYPSNDDFVINLIDDYAGFIFSKMIACFCVNRIISI